MYSIGLLEILGVDGDAEIEKVLQEIAKRAYVQHGDGTLKKLSTPDNSFSPMA